MTPDLALAPRRSSLHSRREAICLLLVSVLLPLFFVSTPSWRVLSWLPLSNLGHITFFALLTLLIHGRRPLTTPKHWIAVTAITLALSIIIELIQGQIGRTASVADVLRNLLGTWLVIAWQRPLYSQLRPVRFLVAGLLAVEIILVGLGGLQRYRIYTQFPLLSTLETPAEIRQWRPVNSQLQRSTLFSRTGRYALRAELMPGQFSGVALRSFPPVWGNHERLQMDVYNPQDEVITITLRVHDRLHETGTAAWQYSDRFNRSFHLQSGWNHIAIDLEDIATAPATRRLDLNQVRELQLFVTGSKKPKVVYLDNLRLD